MSKFNKKIIDTTKSTCIGKAMYNARYSLTMCIKSSNITAEEKTVIVILKNPATTAKQNIFYGIGLDQVTDVDRTTTRIIDLISSGKIKALPSYKKIITVNLFPYYSSNPQDLNAVFPISTITKNQAYNDNITEITNILTQNQNADIICAWGQKSNMSKRILDYAIKDIIQLISSRNCYEIKKATTTQGTTTQGTTTRSQIIVNKTTKPFYPLHAQVW